MSSTKTWYEDLFSRPSYIDIYGPEDTEQAKLEVAQLINLLDLKPGLTLLDVCCGYGRHSIPFAEFGLKVTGIDLSEFQITEAQKRAQMLKPNTRPNFIVADARTYTSRKRFDLVVNLFLSFGYDEHEQNLYMLQNMAKLLKPSGRLVMDFWNRDREVAAVAASPLVWEKVNNYYILKEFTYNPIEGYIEWGNTVIHPKGKVERWRHRVLAYSCAELIRMFNSVNLNVTDVFGDFDGSSLTPASPTLILVARPFSI